MARWVLNCPHCKQEFTHSEISARASSLPDPFLAGSPIKPEFPKDGQSVACPNCTKPSVYQRYQLIHRPS
jgi:endogenous inhibitor of DNA gyrase (YacG/DUF329 family)